MAIKALNPFQLALLRPSERRRIWEESLKEASAFEDEDLVVIPKESITVEEECPTATDFKEFLKWLETQSVDRHIRYIFLHCTATRPNAKVSSIINYWKNNLGWKNYGYNAVLSENSYTVLADLQQVCNGVRGYNSSSVHISYIGGIDANNRPFDTRTPYQKAMMIRMTKALRKKFPNAKVMLHNEVSTKACPSFSREVLEGELYN